MARKKQSKGQSSNLDCVARATLNQVRISPRKARLILELIKGQQVEEALRTLQHSPRRGARIMTTLLNSAVANAHEKSAADIDNLWVTGGWVDMGRTLKRYMPRAHGRMTPIRKRSSRITVLLGER